MDEKEEEKNEGYQIFAFPLLALVNPKALPRVVQQLNRVQIVFKTGGTLRNKNRAMLDKTGADLLLQTDCLNCFQLSSYDNIC